MTTSTTVPLSMAARRCTGDWYPACSSAARIRALVSGATSSRPFTTLETVGAETPACLATVASVGLVRSGNLVVMGSQSFEGGETLSSYRLRVSPVKVQQQLR